jgi:GTPase involved in cell partitioning and DNA repair
MIRTPGEEIVRLREENKELKKYNEDLIGDNNLLSLSNKENEETIQELKEKIDKLRQMAWEMDIPHPTVPEYRELHEKMQKIINYIDEEIYEGIEY